MVSVHSSKILTKTEVGTRDWGFALIGLTMLCFKECIWGFWIWKVVDCFKWGLMGYPSRNIKDFVTESDLNCAYLAQEMTVCGLETVLWYFGKEYDCFLPLS